MKKRALRIHFTGKKIKVKIMIEITAKQSAFAFMFHLFIFLLPMNLFGQETQYKRLYIGDTVPEISFSSVRNYNGQNKSLTDFKNKHIILDFWNVFCKSCIQSFPELERLQEQFKHDLQIILVTPDNADKINTYSKTSVNLKNTWLPMVMSDTLLDKILFPHNTVPYQVWLDKDGVVKATTSASSATIANIRDLLSGTKLNIRMKKDRVDNAVYNEVFSSGPSVQLLLADKGGFLTRLKYYQPILQSTETLPVTNLKELQRLSISTDNNISAGSIDKYYSAIFESFPEISPAPFTNRILNDADGNPCGIRILNKPAYILYQKAFEPTFTRKLIIEPGVPIEGPPGIDEGKEAYNNWWYGDQYCYESFLPDYTEEKGMQKFRNDLENYFGVTGKLEKRKIECLVLYRKDKNDKLRTADANAKPDFENTQSAKGILIRNFSFGDFLQYLKSDHRGINDPLLIDETGLQHAKRFDMQLRVKNLYDSPALRKELARCGLGLKKEIRIMEVLVLKNIKK